MRNGGALHARRVCQTDQQHGKEGQEFPGHRLRPRFRALHLPPLRLPGSCRRPARCVSVKGLSREADSVNSSKSFFYYNISGWVTANGKGLTYLTDPQIHSTKNPKGPSNFAARGLRYFLDEQHGPECNPICQLLNLPPLVTQPHKPIAGRP